MVQIDDAPFVSLAALKPRLNYEIDDSDLSLSILARPEVPGVSRYPGYQGPAGADFLEGNSIFFNYDLDVYRPPAAHPPIPLSPTNSVSAQGASWRWGHSPGNDQRDFGLPPAADPGHQSITASLCEDSRYWTPWRPQVHSVPRYPFSEPAWPGSSPSTRTSSAIRCRTWPGR